MQEALARTSFIHDPLYEEMVQQSAEKCKPPKEIIGYELLRPYIRHCDDNGKIIHMPNGYMQMRSSCAREECTTEYELCLRDSFSLSWLLVPKGEAVIVPKHVIPIVAGYSVDGRKAFIPVSDELELMTESDSPENERSNLTCEECVQTSMFDRYSLFHYVFCLRYPLDTYPRLFGPDDFMRGEGVGIDTTGPYSWRFKRNLPHFEPEESTNETETGVA